MDKFDTINAIFSLTIAGIVGIYPANSGRSCSSCLNLREKIQNGKPEVSKRLEGDGVQYSKRAFPPILGVGARLLILGSMPGEESLRRQQYYAHRRNAFWPIMARLLDLPDDSSYSRRAEALIDHGIALWDVMAECRRTGSLDSAICSDSIRVNDFATLLRDHPGIGLILFNGGTAEREFRRRVVPTLGQAAALIETLRLPSTSPAYAAMPFEAKLAAWSVILERMRG